MNVFIFFYKVFKFYRRDEFFFVVNNLKVSFPDTPIYDPTKVVVDRIVRKTIIDSNSSGLRVFPIFDNVTFKE